MTMLRDREFFRITMGMSFSPSSAINEMVCDVLFSVFGVLVFIIAIICDFLRLS